MTKTLPLEGGYDHGPLFEFRSRRGIIHRNAWLHGARRRRTEREQTPAWVDRKAIADLYRKARRLTRETGERYVVDHIVPLRGKTVCGLHWHGNMRVMHWRENAQKGAFEWPGMPFEQITLF
ncbi:hypothetical protein BcepF1.008 [Burkholderia phage BcepF1]|uniref:Uncharacterized protein n=1 Tax=Burkholderia phage BcepF1 TaxID=2886897 RepID=A1YZR2_9CAUD|nr:hypothetical protein BcepF1.008 [Burkholderia phage BcepF1]ABL96739.1 hypothetical protein BcepF1.008 [Burkholderia phage BcepF1]